MENNELSKKIGNSIFGQCAVVEWYKNSLNSDCTIYVYKKSNLQILAITCTTGIYNVITILYKFYTKIYKN